jgi:hypothetical protein
VSVASRLTRRSGEPETGSPRSVQLLGRDLVDGDDDNRFAYGLEVMHDGLEADVARSGVIA